MQEDGFIDVSLVMKAAVYALLYHGKVMYIGQSIEVSRRVSEHLKNKHRTISNSALNVAMQRIPFDQVWIKPCVKNELVLVEAAMIKKYKPKYNVRGKEETKLSMSDLMKLVPVNTEIKLSVERRL